MNSDNCIKDDKDDDDDDEEEQQATIIGVHALFHEKIKMAKKLKNVKLKKINFKKILKLIDVKPHVTQHLLITDKTQQQQQFHLNIKKKN